MEFATGALGTLLPKLYQLLQDEYNLHESVKKNIEFLSKELEYIRTVLCDLGKVQPEELKPVVRIWASDVRELSYYIEDIIDTFQVRILGPEPPSQRYRKRFIKKMKNMVSMSRHKMAQDIEDIMEKVKEVADRRDRYNITTSTPSEVTIIDHRISALYIEAVDLVGVDEPRDEVIRRLKLDDGMLTPHQNIVSLVGFGGLGKTTIAKIVHEKLKHKFDCTAFVSVSRNPVMNKVLKDILCELDKAKYKKIHNATWDQRHFIDEIREFLQHKRYLIVVDDIWKTESWEIIKLALVNSRGSRIIITTRNFEVAKQLGGVCSLQPLSHDYGKILFYKRIGDTKGKYNEENEVVTKILRKCSGVPLAIITIASLLAGRAQHCWSEVYESIGFGGNKGDQHVENTKRILSFSYYDLPDYLRTCLLYLSVFPEDHYIPMHTLIWQWIAEGFVQEQNTKKLFEIGEGYFNELVNRSMIQPIEWQEMHKGSVRGCRLHDMMLDVIRSIACEENFVTVADNMQDALYNCKARRSSLLARTHVEQNPQMNCTAISKLRTLHAIRSKIKKMAPFSSFRVLRVLRLEYCEFNEGSHLKDIKHLHHLRYLGLVKTTISELPREIGGLKFLQTLELVDTGIKELPSSVGQLTQLLCLNTSRYMTVPKDGVIAKLTSLEELKIYPGTDIQSSRRLLKELGMLTQLRVLRTEISIGEWDEEMQGALVQSVRNLHRIKVLEVNGKNFREHAVTWDETAADHFKNLRNVYLRFGFQTLPAWINQYVAPNLTTLYLAVKYLKSEDLKTIGRLPELCSLDLFVWEPRLLEFIGDNNIYFQKLRFLWTNKLVLFKPHTPTTPIMPTLEYMKFHFCIREFADVDPYLNRTNCFHFLPSLRQVCVTIDCRDAPATAVLKVEGYLTVIAVAHPNRNCGIPQLIRKNEDKILPSDQPQEIEDMVRALKILILVYYRQLAARLKELRTVLNLKPDDVKINEEIVAEEEVSAAASHSQPIRVEGEPLVQSIMQALINQHLD